MAKLVDALDLGSSGATCGGSSPSIRTIYIPDVLLCHERKSQHNKLHIFVYSSCMHVLLHSFHLVEIS
jgi:hypothetical protein